MLNLNDITKDPKAIDEAVNRLLITLNARELQKIKTTAKNDLILLHFILGKSIRNAFDLNNDNTIFLNDKCADDISIKIIDELWGKLQVI